MCSYRPVPKADCEVGVSNKTAHATAQNLDREIMIKRTELDALTKAEAQASLRIKAQESQEEGVLNGMEMAEQQKRWAEQNAKAARELSEKHEAKAAAAKREESKVCKGGT